MGSVQNNTGVNIVRIMSNSSIERGSLCAEVSVALSRRREYVSISCLTLQNIGVN